MPDGFRKMYPSTRVIVDGTEIPLACPKNPTQAQACFSTYKNRATEKILVGATPSGLISYCSDAFAGSVSDRAIVERSDLIEKCDPGDSVMADRGFTVQDLFAHRNVAVNIPSFLKGQAQLPGLKLLQDRKLASKRVHIERVIGLVKTFKILKKELPAYYVPLGSQITFICCMLCNFREGIVSRSA
ncbi:Putative transposase for insertion sequence element IS112 [Frankliniella fusca]|uniref:Transposase for insertion sequence element IS112 n=1 Tax=Frankliniella fusca TaxID=407009 RepID=A0AAE1LNX6_9NEOP|nr:Putative transposase for insertion sequence element IS112 [Frankliniella fusca]